ncbi:MAG: ABC transporter ATP-binding protein [Candidatus Babeliales bacterium]
MKSIQLKNVKKSYAGELVLEHFSLTIPSGKFFALLGPSGSGKTTILRLIAGFDSVDSGTIFLGNHDITNTPIYKRTVNTVFQNYALFPHLTVFENIAYSQRVRGLPAVVIEQRVNKILRTVHLQAHAHKSIAQLSGGQKQRVALARAIINEPDVLLLDEPLTALDPEMRERMLLELIELQSNLQTTFVYVTHDHSEALAVADQMAILNHNGEVEQVGTPREIYEYPVSSFVAQFVGTTNLFKGIVIEQGAGLVSVDVANIGVIRVFAAEYRPWAHALMQVFVSVRPEKILITKKQVAGFANSIQGVVVGIIYYGRSTQYNVRVAGEMVSVFEQNEEHIEKEIIDYDDHVYLYWHEKNAVLLER